MAKQYFWLVAALVLTCFSPGVAAQVSSGTAFAVAPEFLVTNQHVIAGCTSVEVIAADGRRTGSVVDSDAQIDLALLRVTGIKGPTARLRSPRNVRLGESVMVFGFPLTGSLSSGGNFTSGVVSALRGLRDAAGAIQITAPVQPGNSGGPLIDASGLVIGVVQAKLDALRSARATGDIPQNVNFAISLEILADFLIKNNVTFRDGTLSSPLDTAKVAELAQSFTYRVECRSDSRQSVKSPDIKPNPPTAGLSGDALLPQKAKVLSTIDTPGYTYIEITQNNKTLWLATATVAVKSGDVIRFDNGMVMTNFNSKTLNRTFPSVTFVNRLVVTIEKE
jgi:S1-C subfamily serine protease